jgi:hypothetical protein
MIDTTMSVEEMFADVEADFVRCQAKIDEARSHTSDPVYQSKLDRLQEELNFKREGINRAQQVAKMFDIK